MEKAKLTDNIPISFVKELTQKQAELVYDMYSTDSFYKALPHEDRTLLCKITQHMEFSHEAYLYGNDEKNRLNGIRDRWMDYRKAAQFWQHVYI